MYKNLIIGWVILFILLPICTVSAELEPEFDGVYILKTDGTYIELEMAKQYIDITAYDFSGKTKSLHGILPFNEGPVINSNDFKALVIRSSNPKAYNHWSLHNLIKVNGLRSQGYKSASSVYYRPFNLDTEYFGWQNNYELQQKKYGTSSFYFKPKEKLKEGAYVFKHWNRGVIHVFNIDSKKMEEIGNSSAKTDTQKEESPSVGNNTVQPNSQKEESSPKTMNETSTKVINSLLNGIFKKK